jgi:hypothetical protein
MFFVVLRDICPHFKHLILPPLTLANSNQGRRGLLLILAPAYRRQAVAGQAGARGDFLEFILFNVMIHLDIPRVFVKLLRHERDWVKGKEN